MTPLRSHWCQVVSVGLKPLSVGQTLLPLWESTKSVQKCVTPNWEAGDLHTNLRKVELGCACSFISVKPFDFRLLASRTLPESVSCKLLGFGNLSQQP